MKSSWTKTIERYIAEGRTVSGGKGGDTANQQRQQELQMQQEAFKRQMAQLDKINSAFSSYLTGKVGFDPSQLAGMTSQFLNNNSSTFNQAGQQVREALGARGEGLGNLPVSGDYVRGIAPLMGARAQSQSQGLLGINVQNAMQALQNKFNAGNLMSGNAAQLVGTQGVAGNAASSALQSYVQAQNSGLLQNFMGGLGQGLGGGLSTFGLGGLSKIAGSFGGGAPTATSWMPTNPVPGQAYYKP